MKKTNTFILIAAFMLSVTCLFAATSGYDPDPALKSVYQSPEVRAAVDFLKDELPELIKTNPEQAVAQYEQHFASLNQLDELDILYLVGHFYAVSNDALSALKYLPSLANHPQLGEDARRMINLLLYQRMIVNMRAEDKESSALFLQGIMENFDVGKYYPTYLYLWTDLVSGSERYGEVDAYFKNYNANEAWLNNHFIPRKKAIIARVEAFDLEGFYNDPTQKKYKALEGQIDKVIADLRTLYEEARTVKGLAVIDVIEEIASQEMKLLNDLKTNLKDYSSTPEISLEAIADPNSSFSQIQYFDRYRPGLEYLGKMKEYQRLLGVFLKSMERIFEIRYQQFVNEDPAVVGRSYSDMELKRLIDIERNIIVYSDLIDAINEAMAAPEYERSDLNLQPLLEEYQEKLQDLQIRKEQYTNLRKHDADAEEETFNEFLAEYYTLQGELEDWTLTIDEVEGALLADIMLRYPDEMRQVAMQLKDQIQNPELQMDMDGYLSRVLTNIDFISLQSRYRHLNYLDAKRKADTTLSMDESTQAYEDIVIQKSQLLRDYQEFVVANPGFEALDQPDDSFLVSLADVYYNMGELQWATDFDHPEKALAYYRMILNVNPDFYLKEYVLYNAAYLSSEVSRMAHEQNLADWQELNPNSPRGDAQKIKESDFREAITNYQTILEDYPTSPLFDEAAYRLANLYFLVGTDAERPIEWYNRANELYTRLAAKSDSPYRYEALFQRAFVNMNISDETSLQAALQDFVTILNAVDNQRITPASTAQELKLNSLDQIAYCLVALDGADFDGESRGLNAINTYLAGYQDEDVILYVMDKAFENKKDMKLTRQSIDYLELRMQRTPNALVNPSLVDSVVVLFYANDISLRPGENRDQIRRDKYSTMTNQFGKGSVWFDRNIRGKDLSDPEIARQLASIRNAYRQTQIVLYEAVRTSNSEQAYQEYVAHTNKFMAYEELFGPQVYGAYTQLLDHLFKTRPADYDAEFTAWKLNAEKEDLMLLRHLADANQTDEAYMRIYNKLLAYNQAHLDPSDPEYFENEELAYSYALSREELLADKLEGQALEDLYAFLQSSTDRYIVALRGSGDPDKIAQADMLVLDMAHNAFNKDRYAEAKTRYLHILENYPNLDNNSKYDIYLNLAFIAQDDESLSQYDRYRAAEQYARQAMEYTTDGTRLAKADQMVKLQIQNIYKAAISGNDYTIAAAEFGRMAEEFTYESHPEEHLNYKRLQAEQYQKAKQYDKLVETYMYLASKERADDIDQIYTWYYMSWTTADSLMHDANYARNIRNEFMERFPSSNQTFTLKVMELEKMAANPSTKLAAAEGYLALSEDVRTNRIDSGNVKSENIYMQAFTIYDQDQSSPKRLEVLDGFIQLYPGHPDVTGMLRTLAAGYYAQGDTIRFEEYAQRLFERDKEQYDLYQGVAVKYLSRILQQYDTAYLNKDWEGAFRKRDEFKALEANYRRQGLPLDTSEQYKAFAAAEAEHKEIQAYQAFLREFDRQLAALENSDFMRQSPNQHITVNANTSFMKNLMGGKTSRLPNFRTAVVNQVNRVERLIAGENQQKLDTGRITKALALEAKIYEFGVEVVQTQINKFLDVSNEVRPYRDDPNVVATIWGQVNSDYVYPMEDAANAIYATLFNTFHLAGYENATTRHAISKLEERGLKPDYKKVEYPLGRGWTLKALDDDGNFVPANLVINSVTTPKGQVLGTVNIPPKAKLQAEFTLNSTIAPSFVFLQVIYPYDPEAFVNGKEANLVGFAVDSLDVTQAITARYGYQFGGAEWNAQQNSIRLLFPNRYQDQIPVRFTLQAYYDNFELSQARPKETLVFSSNASCRALIADPESGAETAIPSRVADNSGMPPEAIEGFKDGRAQVIWVAEDSESPVEAIAFETNFTINGELVSAQVEFVAPMTANVILNGETVATDIYVDMDEDPLTFYPNLVDLPVQLLKNGSNTLRIEVENPTPYRGLISEIKIEKYKE